MKIQSIITAFLASFLISLFASCSVTSESDQLAQKGGKKLAGAPKFPSPTPTPAPTPETTPVPAVATQPTVEVYSVRTEQPQPSLMTFHFSRYLPFDSTDPEVVDLQTLLVWMKCMDMPEGVKKGRLRHRTQKGIAKLQERFGITPTGNFGPEIRAYINNHPATFSIPCAPRPQIEVAVGEKPTAQTSPAPPKINGQYFSDRTTPFCDGYNWYLLPAHYRLVHQVERHATVEEVRSLTQRCYGFEYMDIHRWVSKLPDRAEAMFAVGQGRRFNCPAKAYWLLDAMRDPKNTVLVIGDYRGSLTTLVGYNGTILGEEKIRCHTWLEWWDDDGQLWILDPKYSNVPVLAKNLPAGMYTPYYKVNKFGMTMMGGNRTVFYSGGPLLASSKLRKSR